MVPRVIFGLALLLPAALSAQQGSIAYTHSVKLDIEIPEELRARVEARSGNRPGAPGGMFPTERVSEVVLLFNDSESLMKPVPPAPPRAGQRDGTARRRAGVAARMRMNSVSRRDRETLGEAHVSYDEGRIVETRDFLGRTFLIEDDRPALEWRLTSEQAEFLDYVVIKATAQQDSSTIEAWFTPQIPIPGGPGTYGGLPGMILVLTVDDGDTSYTATEVSMATIAEGVIVRPTEGEAVTRQEYETIVAEKLEELRSIGGGSRP